MKKLWARLHKGGGKKRPSLPITANPRVRERRPGSDEGAPISSKLRKCQGKSKKADDGTPFLSLTRGKSSTSTNSKDNINARKKLKKGKQLLNSGVGEGKRGGNLRMENSWSGGVEPLKSKLTPRPSEGGGETTPKW